MCEAAGSLVVELATDRFIARQFAAWLGHPDAVCDAREDLLSGRFCVTAGPVRVAFPMASYHRLQRMRVEDMAEEFRQQMEAR